VGEGLNVPICGEKKETHSKVTEKKGIKRGRSENAQDLWENPSQKGKGNGWLKKLTKNQGSKIVRDTERDNEKSFKKLWGLSGRRSLDEGLGLHAVLFERRGMVGSEQKVRCSRE